MAQSAAPTLLSWYNGLPSRWVDLVGDYAGEELFAIEGDSLLLHCFQDPGLDFDDGFQLLHAVYLVERFLHQLVTRKCNFDVVFFKENRHNSVPPNTEQSNRSKYLFAREAIIQHLIRHHSTIHPVRVYRFDAPMDPRFLSYRDQESVYFIMCHDGARPMRSSLYKDTSGQHKTFTYALERGDETKGLERLSMRGMIMLFVTGGMNITLINGLEWRDTKESLMLILCAVMVQITQSRRSVDIDQRRAMLSEYTEVQMTIKERSTAEDSLGLEELIQISRENWTLSLGLPEGRLEQDWLSLWVIENLLGEDERRMDLVLSFLLHLVLVRNMPLSQRRVKDDGVLAIASDGEERITAFLSAFASKAAVATETLNWTSTGTMESHGDFADMVDGKLFRACMNIIASGLSIESFPETIRAELLQYADSVNATAGLNKVFGHQVLDSTVAPSVPVKKSAKKLASLSLDTEYPALPFSNSVFDEHLASVKLAADPNPPEHQASAGKIFREISHWHNAKRLLDKSPAITAASKFLKSRRLRSNQLYMNEMTAYAASLTNAAGKLLEPEVIVTARPAKDIRSGAKGSMPRVVSTSMMNETTEAPDSTDKSTKPGSKAPVAKKHVAIKGKNTIRDEITAQRAKKDQESAEKTTSAWKVKRASLDAIKDLSTRFTSVQEYLNDLSMPKLKVLEADILLYMLQILISVWYEYRKAEKFTEGYPIAALACSFVVKLAEGPFGMTQAIATAVGQIAYKLRVPVKEIRAKDPRRTFHLESDLSKSGGSLDVSLPMSWAKFQLLHYGPYLDRNMDSAPDPRVTFEPDGWQRKVLDELDMNRSVFVVAPTSAGKTFISFYAMEKVLRDNDDGVLVYVAPTKALVNQIAAEIQARFSKTYKAGGKSVWAIHTRDYRVNNPTGCQILVTVPHILQMMLLSSTNARSWSTRVRRIIFDEIHCIGQAEDGVIWEQLLLLAPCPIIALSATVGNPEQFNDWLRSTQQAIGHKLTMISHAHRYSDLRKFIYQPPTEFAFSKFVEKSPLVQLGLDDVPGFRFVHPVNSLVNTARGIPDDLSFEARDCYTLWKALKKHQPLAPWASEELPDPLTALPTFAKKADIINWERKLKAELNRWMTAYPEMFSQLIQELSCLPAQANSEAEPPSDNTSEALSGTGISTINPDDLHETTLPLLCRLHEQGALPALLFNYDRGKCESIAEAILTQLTVAESKWKETDHSWRTRIQGWEIWKKAQTKKPPKSLTKKGKSNIVEPQSKALSAMEAASREVDAYETFNPDDPVDGFHFADKKRLLKAELEGYFDTLRWKGVAEWLLECLTRGIGVHHAGMNRKYRQVVEILFRKRFLRVVIATGTLALGINMPCKTAAGRAGRRGFDLLGNVVFQNISYEKVCRLLSSRLPDLNGHFPVTTTLVLRLFSLLHGSNYSTYATKAITSLLSQPRLYLGGKSFKEQVLHHLRFSIEFLRRQELLSSEGAPLNFAECVSHLYFTENSSFGFHALLREGYFHELCSEMGNQEECLKTLMVVLSHLFGRRACRQADQEFIEEVVKKSPSTVFLPTLPKEALKVLRGHNKETLKIFTGYVKTFVDQHIKMEDNRMPLTQWLANSGTAVDSVPLPLLPPTKTRSAFVALSGHGDTFQSISELCETARDGVFLEKAVIPHAEIYPDESSTPFNAYLYDFYMHGDVTALEKANGIRKSDVWFLLNDFSLVLATIVTSLTNFLKLDPASDSDLLDVVGEGDELEIENDAALAQETGAAVDETKKLATASARQEGNSSAAKGRNAGKKNKLADSWEDGDDVDVDAPAKNSRVLPERKCKSKAVNPYDDESDSEESEEDANSKEQGGLIIVLKAFTMLQKQFDERFRAIWA
ncbi:MAG: hypothetical protein M1816_005616 [Peltula sp. TS41687]|nr:MAG: hypothetical protein M1816_005616 [Peltula sp. TS41687]